MKLILPIAIFALCSIGSAHAENTTAQAEIESATISTQLLAAHICGEKANLDPKKIQANSPAFAFLLALKSIATPDDLKDRSHTLVNRVQSMRCNDEGMLETSIN